MIVAGIKMLNLPKININVGDGELLADVAFKTKVEKLEANFIPKTLITFTPLWPKAKKIELLESPIKPRK